MDEQDPVPYLESILEECNDAIQYYKESKDLTKIIWFTQRCIPRLENLETWSKHEYFLECLQKYNRWIAKQDINGHEHVVVKIDNIDWGQNIVNWHNTTEEYPKGGSTFSSFKEEFFPWRY